MQNASRPLRTLREGNRLRLNSSGEETHRTVVTMNVNVETPQLRSGVVYSDPDVALGCCRDMFFVLWKHRTTVQNVATLGDCFDRFARNRSKELALVTIVSIGAERSPSSEARRKLAAWLGEASNRLLISAVVFEGDGFLAAVIRGVVTGLTLLAKPNCPHRVVASVWDAGAWFQSSTAGGPRVLKRDYVMARVSEFRQAVPVFSSAPV